MRSIYALMLTLLITLSANSQDSLVLNVGDFIDHVIHFHPVARQASNLDRMSEASALKARGVLDPYVSANIDQKYFKDENYFRFIEGNLSIPTKLPVEVISGYDLNDGVNLNPSDLLPASGLYHVGVKMELLQGLLFDERRAALKQADIIRQENTAQKELIYNEVIADALTAYSKWLWARERYIVLSRYVDLAKITADASTDLFANGDVPAIDTLNAHIEWLNRQSQMNEAEIELFKARLGVSNFLWLEDGNAIILDPNVRPMSTDSLILFLSKIEVYDPYELDLSGHPVLRLLQTEIDRLGIDGRLIKEKLKPRLSVKYSPFLYDLNERPLNDYKWQVNFSAPIFVREGRGALRLNEAKSDQVQLKYSASANKLQNSLLQLDQEVSILKDQRQLLTSVQNGYDQLITAERQSFRLGDSEILRINIQEQKWLEANLKRMDIDLKVHQTTIKLLETRASFSDQLTKSL